MNLSSSITPYDVEEGAIESVYDVTIIGENILTTVTQHPDAVTSWINAVNAEGGSSSGVRHIGIEFEMDEHMERMGTVQLCVGSRCLIFQLPESDIPLPESLNEFLANQNNCFVGVETEPKLERLRAQCPFQAQPVRCVDLIFSPLDRAPSDEVDTHWATPGLSPRQVLFACVDAFFNIQTARMLWSGK